MALRRLKEGTYGYCEETGEQIGLKRLIARPIATLTIEAQNMREMKKYLLMTKLLVFPRLFKKIVPFLHFISSGNF